MRISEASASFESQVLRANNTFSKFRLREAVHWRLKVLGKLSFDFFRRSRGIEAGDDLAIFSHQEFGEIPSDVLVAFTVGVARFEKFVEIGRAVPVHLDL